MTGHLEVGRIHRSHGLKGEVVVSLVTNRVERLEPGSLLTAGDEVLEVVTARRQGDRWVVRFSGVETREASDLLRGRVLTAEALEDPDELWVHDLIGARVVEVGGTERGVVEAVLANPASDLLQLDTGALVPLTFVVDRADDALVIDPPDGLFDL